VERTGEGVVSVRFVDASAAPEGWRHEGSDDSLLGRLCATWLTDTGELVLVPVRYEECDYCEGTGDNPNCDEEDLPTIWSYCPECDGEGVDPDSATFDFDGAVSKGTAMRLKALGTTDLAGVQWWKGGV
jgi:hypothetical protein